MRYLGFMDATNILALANTLPSPTTAAERDANFVVFELAGAAVEVRRSSLGWLVTVAGAALTHTTARVERMVELVLEALGLAPVEAAALASVGDVVLVEGNPCEVTAVETDALELAPVTCPITGRTSAARMTARRYDGAWYDAGWLAMIEIQISGPVLMVATNRAIEYVAAA
jgi:hypothetical protein